MLLQRLKVAIPLIILVLLAFLLPGWPGTLLFLVFAALMLAGGLWETLVLSGQKHLAASFVPCCLYGLISLIVAACSGLRTLDNTLMTVALEILNATLLLLLLFLVSFQRHPDQATLNDVLRGLAGGVYLCWTLAFLARLYFMRPGGPALLCYLVAITKAADIGAYFLGSFTAKLPNGNHKLARLVSPKKSWEGLLGGLILSLLVSMLFLLFFGRHLVFCLPWIKTTCPLGFLDALLLGILAPVIGLLGDLAESVMKRAAGAKDSGHIPGLGGVLDILDSLIPMAPFFFGYMLLRLALACP